MVYLQRVHNDEQAKLHNIMQFYFYEFSQYIHEIKLENDGLYKPYNLEKYSTEDDHHAFFIMLDDELIGFALIEAASTSPNSVQEFFIMGKHAGKGYGKIAAKQLLTMFPGEWEITQIEQNERAHAFWIGLINDVSGGHFIEHHDDGVYVQKFTI